MLLFYGKPGDGPHQNDENADRAARLAALRESFYKWKRWPEFSPENKLFAPVAIHWLQQEKKADRHVGLKKYGENAQILVLNAHGNEYQFDELGASGLADMLMEIGLRDAGTKEIWLASCNNGRQTQDNSRPVPIAKKLASLLGTRHGLYPKIHAPRGFLAYHDRTVKGSGLTTTIHYGRVVAEVDEEGTIDVEGRLHPHEYPFEKGAWVWAQS